MLEVEADQWAADLAKRMGISKSEFYEHARDRTPIDPGTGLPVWAAEVMPRDDDQQLQLTA